MRIKTQIQPASFIPKTPAEFIGYAATVAKVFAAKAAAARADKNSKVKFLLTGEPGIGKTRLAEFLAEQLTGEHVTEGQSFSVESINGRMIDAAMLRGWRDAGRYVPAGFSVKIINEIDTLGQDKEDALLSYLDESPRKTAVIGTSNLKAKELTPRLQSRFQSFHVLPPTESEIKTLVSRWNVGKANINNIPARLRRQRPRRATRHSINPRRITRMNTTLTAPPASNVEQSLTECCRRGYYLCGHCSRIGHVGQYFEDTKPRCPHCHKSGVMEWHPPVLDEQRN